MTKFYLSLKEVKCRIHLVDNWIIGDKWGNFSYNEITKYDYITSMKWWNKYNLPIIDICKEENSK